MPLIREGRNLVIISPSASGKTEAVAAPLVERFIAGRGTRLSILYVSPTRALVNDLYRRLCDPMEYLGLPLARKTGDHPAIEEKKLPFMLITTPESFDSLLCRHTAVFRDLAAVVLDELHLLDNSPRGDQLRALLDRLRLVNDRLQYCALSATIDDTVIGERYFPDPVVVKVEDERAIEAKLLPLDEGWHARAVEELRRRGSRKVLCFFNARSWAESAVEQLDLPPFRGRVWVHHGSLHRRVREETEQNMNREQIGLLCCTSTLELGIDIGDVDAVVLVRPPFNVSSLLQRIGRGNRRQQSSLFALGFHTDGWERFLFETFLDCARHGRLYEKRYVRSLAVVPQQIISYLFQRRRIGATERSVVRALGTVFGPEAVTRVFRHMATEEYVVSRRAGIFFLGPRLEKQVTYGHIHSNIQQKSFGKYEVYDVTTNRHLGTVFFVFRTFMLNGRSWELVEFREKEGRVMVRPSGAVGVTTKVFEGTGSVGYGYRMAQVLRSTLFPDLAPDELPCFEEGGQLFVVHLLGTTYGYLLTEAFERAGMAGTDLDGRLFAFPAGRRPERFPVPDLSVMRAVVEHNRARLEDGLGSGSFLRMLPPDLQVEDHMLGLDIAGLFSHLGGLRLRLLPSGVVAGRIADRVRKGDAGFDSGGPAARF